MFSKRADQINYARVEGIEHKELPAAIIFAAIYVPLLCLCIFYSMRSTYVYKSLTLFCLIRIVAFVMRAVLAASATAGNNINLVVAQMVIYNIGFSGLLYSAYGLVLDRYSMVAPSEGKGAGLLRSLKSLIRNRMLFRAAVTAAIVLGIVGGVYQANLDNPSQMSQGNTLRKASLYIFLGVVCLLCLVTIDLAFIERNAKAWNTDVASVGRRYGVAILLFVSLMLILREAYLAATTGNIVKQNKPATWYTLVATPETLCMFLFMVPGLVPNKQEISESQEEPAGWIASSHIPLRPQV